VLVINRDPWKRNQRTIAKLFEFLATSRAVGDRRSELPVFPPTRHPTSDETIHTPTQHLPTVPVAGRRVP
jgi:hypothetical protein